MDHDTRMCRITKATSKLAEVSSAYPNTKLGDSGALGDRLKGSSIPSNYLADVVTSVD